MDRKFEDDRALRRDLTGLESGALGGAALGLLVGFIIPGVGTVVAAVGGLAGAALGRALTKRVYLEEWDTSMVHPYVGLQAPDGDAT